MNKDTIIALLKDYIEEINNLTENGDFELEITEKTKLIKEAKDAYANIEFLNLFDLDEDELKIYHNVYTQKLNALKALNTKTVEVKTEKSSNAAKYIIGALAALVLIPAVFYPAKLNSDEEDILNERLESLYEFNSISNVNINNESKLLEYAKKLNQSMTGLTTDEIVSAIKLANYEKLDNKDVFENREDVLKSTLNIGNIITKLGSDAIVKKTNKDDIYVTDATLKDIITSVTNNKVNIDSFKDAKTKNGYDLLKVSEIAINNMYKNNDLDDDYAMILNDIIARSTRDFTIIENRDLQTIYTLLGMYNANLDRVNKLTAGRLLGPIYGNGVKIDGTYGDVCVEQLVKAVEIKNNKGHIVGSNGSIFYNEFIDDVLLTNGRAR